MEEMVTISKEEHEELLDRVNLLEALECMGVDNWQGYGDAYELYNEWKEQD